MFGGLSPSECVGYGLCLTGLWVMARSQHGCLIFVDDTKYYNVQCSVVGQVFLYRLAIQIFRIDTYLGLLNCHSLGKIDTSNPRNT